MAESRVLDLNRLRRGCAQCSLRQLCLPAGIGADDLDRLDAIVRRRRPFEGGERLFRVGDPLEALYVASDGAFKTAAVTGEGREQVLGFHLPGELIGLDALGAGEHRCEAIALTVSRVCEVPFDQLADVATQIPGLQQQLLRVIGQSVGRDQAHVDVLERRHAVERIAMFLHGLSERYTRIGQSGSRLRLPMSREGIGGYLGLALETVSRGFTRLQDAGVIAVAGRRVAIVDAAALHRLAHAPDAGKSKRHGSMPGH